ncbi:MAG: MerR family transcriptional regulator [Lachnospiraceae bacterium]|nr:MerR family transcriptional regulator [Lachnospiraceae bacterium]MCI9334875.1 MerR family transcriptional regulator [Lachnospiraceae bacterium]
MMVSIMRLMSEGGETVEENLKKMETLTPDEVAPMLGVSADTLRSWMRHGLIHIGIADKKDGSDSKYNYTIWRPHLERFMQGLII